MLLADEFFLLALDDRTGRPVLSPRVFALGLAGALLGELVLDRRIAVHTDRIAVAEQRPPADALARWVHGHLLAEVARHDVRTWLVFLAQDARDQVAERLRRAGHIQVQNSRRLLRSEVIYPPTDINAAAAPRVRIAHALGRRLPMQWPDVTLAGLAVATGLGDHVLYSAEPAAQDYLRHLMDHLPPSVHELVWHLHAAVGDAVLTGRT